MYARYWPLINIWEIQVRCELIIDTAFSCASVHQRFKISQSGNGR